MSVQIIDASSLLANPPPPIEWALEGVLPVGTVGDIFGPPGDGKSSLTLDFAVTVASGARNWYGLPCVAGPVVLLGGERSGIAAFSRDIHRAAKGRHLEPGQLLMPGNGNLRSALWQWVAKTTSWEMTSWGEEITNWLKEARPALILIDTLTSAAQGANIIDQPQQYSLGVTIRMWARQMGDPTVLTISHTNQSSAQQEITWRLHYLSRAGGNGLPGALRWAAGATRLLPSDDMAAKLDLSEKARESRLLAFAVSKHNEMPLPRWHRDAPAIFEMMPEGGLLLLMDGREVGARLKKKDENQKKAKDGKKSSGGFGFGRHLRVVPTSTGNHGEDFVEVPDEW